MWQHRIGEFVTLAVIFDPAGTLPIFVALTSGLSAAQRRRAAILAIFIAFWVLVAFIAIGEILFQAMGIPLLSFQIAGGVAMFLYALKVILGDAREISGAPTRDRVLSLAIYPIAVPNIAGAGSILVVVLLTANTRYSIPEQIGTVLVLAFTMFLYLGILLLANPISRFIGSGGSQVLQRLMGLVLAAVAVNTVVSALVGWLGLPSP